MHAARPAISSVLFENRQAFLTGFDQQLGSLRKAAPNGRSSQLRPHVNDGGSLQPTRNSGVNGSAYALPLAAAVHALKIIALNDGEGDDVEDTA
jgi:hypothetical protein